MKRHGALIALAAGLMVLIPAAAGAGLGPTPVAYGNDYLPPGGYACPAIPEILRQAGEILGAINNPDRQSKLAEQWLQYSKQVIAKDQEYRQQWLDFQRQQAARQQQVEELRLEIARLQMQVEQLRAQNARLERENLLSQAKLGQTSGDRTAAASGTPALGGHPSDSRGRLSHPGQALWSKISALLFGAERPAERDSSARR
jgi:chromosome segregation ATPase